MSNWHDKTLTEQSATCPTYGITWTVGDIVAIQVPRGHTTGGTITGFRVVMGETFADIEKKGNFCSFRLTEKLSELSCHCY